MSKTITLLLFMISGTATAQFSLDSLNWLGGHWIHAEGAEVQEEFWMAPAGGMMPGVHRDVQHGRETFFEYMRIVEIDGGLFYHASPGGGPETIFRADSTADRFVRFVNPGHDYPQRIVYALDSSGNLAAMISDAKGGQVRVWVFRRKGE